MWKSTDAAKVLLEEMASNIYQVSLRLTLGAISMLLLSRRRGEPCRGPTKDGFSS